MDKHVKDREVYGVTKGCFLKYVKQVVQDRALPDWRDGLKPVQRRVIWEMFKQRLYSNSDFKKCAKIVGGTIGNWHPHGDTACYGSLVTMVHMNYPLIEGHGNFGGMTSSAAAYRYTEARLTDNGESYFADIKSINLVPNYSGDYQEPPILPARFPVLVNGAEGIAIGVTTSIPPHNLGEINKALEAVIDGKDAAAILRCVSAPDYGQGVLLSERKEVLELYKIGKGSLYWTADYEIKAIDARRSKLIIASWAPKFTEGNYYDFKEACIEKGLKPCDTRDGGMIVTGGTISIKAVLEYLETKTNYRFVLTDVLADKPVVLHYNLVQILRDFVDFRRKVCERELKRMTKECADQIYLEELKIKVLDRINKVAKCLKNGWELTKAGFTEEEAKIVGEMRIASLRRDRVDAKIKDLNEQKKGFEDNLANLDDYVKTTLLEDG